MLTLDELGISQTPWHLNSEYPFAVFNAKGYAVCEMCEMTDRDCEPIKLHARLIAAAPMLYEVAAWCREQADEIGRCCISGGVNPYAIARCMAGIVRRCEAALAAASGESEVAK